MVWIDPLLNYIGDDASQQKVVSEFCGHLLNPISERTGVIWCLMHHTGKPPSDPKAHSHWTGTDLAYSGLGSSALTNWAREVAVLSRIKLPGDQPPTFRFTLCKRRKRAGMCDRLGNPSESIFLRHADHGLCWVACDEPKTDETVNNAEKSVSTRSAGRPKAIETSIPEFDEIQALSREQTTLLAALYGISEATLKRRWKEYRDNKNNEESL